MKSSGKFSLSQPKSNKVFVDKISSWIDTAVKKITSSEGKEGENWNIMVTEIQCNDPNCVPIETLVVIIGSGNQKYSNKILKPIAEVVESDVEELMNAWEFYRLSSQEQNDRLLDLSSELIEVKGLISGHLKSFQSKEKKMKYLLAIEQMIKDQLTDISTEDELPELLEAEASTSVDVTVVPMMSKSTSAAAASSNQYPKITVYSGSNAPAVRHEKGARGPRGCPCCDPDNIDNITDRMLFFDTPP